MIGGGPEYHLQVAVSDEDLQCGSSSRDFRRVAQRVRQVLDLSVELCDALEPLGWQLLSVRFEQEVGVVLVKYAPAATIIWDLQQLPERVRAQFGETVRVCVTAGEHVFEVRVEDGHFKQVDASDMSGFRGLPSTAAPSDSGDVTG